ncbi:hypothetical protein niasHT_008571 [Heterodera trifolii]|uniref:FLYWCH-type domain-containing protein n=1 Tax=Heterodera trifolii TaxID=157864 RepID=A0ABD2MA40_9BILA
MNLEKKTLTNEMSKPRNVQATKCPSHEMPKPRNVHKDISNTTEEAMNFGVEIDETQAMITSDNVEQHTLNEAELSAVTFERGKTNFGGHCLWLNGFRFTRDFEKAEIASVRTAFPTAQIKCCMFHYGQSLYRNFKRLGLVHLYGEKTERGEEVRNTFRSVLSLPLLPPSVVRMAFSIIVASAPAGMHEFFLYFSRTYIGLTQRQLLDGATAFGANQISFLSSANHSELLTTMSTINSEHSYAAAPIQFGIGSPAPSTLTWPTTMTPQEQLVQYSLSSLSTSTVPSVPVWEEEICRAPHFPIPIWNMHSQAASALARTNNGLEATHLHFMKGLCHHPALSDFICGVNESIDRQVDAARSARHFIHKRHKRYILQDAVIMRILADASYNSNGEIRDLMTALGLQIEGYAAKLKDFVNFDESIGGLRIEAGQFRLASSVWPVPSRQFRLGPVPSWASSVWPVPSGQFRLASSVLVLKGPPQTGNNIVTKRNNKKLEHEGCLYVFHLLNADGDVKFWRCEHQHGEFKCRGRLHTTLNDVVLKTVGVHTCNHSAANVIAQKITTGIKRRAAETMETPAAIRAHTLQQIPTPVMAKIPTKNATKKLVKRVRHEIELPPPVPQTLQELELPEQYRIYKRTEEAQELFLLADSGTYTENGRDGQQRILIFGRLSFGNWASEMKYIYADGTFASAPTSGFKNCQTFIRVMGENSLPDYTDP